MTRVLYNDPRKPLKIQVGFKDEANNTSLAGALLVEGRHHAYPHLTTNELNNKTTDPTAYPFWEIKIHLTFELIHSS